jgi:glycosyltransferase involved in cell wall biosynthesis
MLKVISPVDNSVYAERELAKAADVDRALDLARKAQTSWREVPLAERARLIPRQPLERVPLYMAAADILVLPSHSEGTPNVVLEALASGRRVVATAVGGVPDLLTSPTLGTLVPPGDPDALADALMIALRQPYDADQVAKLGARGGWAASAAALHAVLEEAAKVT